MEQLIEWIKLFSAIFFTISSLLGIVIFIAFYNTIKKHNEEATFNISIQWILFICLYIFFIL